MAEFKVVTGDGIKHLSRFSYLSVWEPKTSKDDPTKKTYEASVIIPKSDKDTIKRVRAAIAGAKAEGMEKVYGGKVIESKFHDPLKDGDERIAEQIANEEEPDMAYENSYYLSARSKERPGLVDHNVDDILDQSSVYSGMWGRASVSFFPYAFEGKKGVGCALNNIQKIKDGESLGGAKPSAKMDFQKISVEDIDDDDMLN